MGVDVLLCGPLPTPAISNLTTSMRADAGAVISASHNPYQDNGIKFFSADGFKLPDEVEADIEDLIANDKLRPPAAHRHQHRQGVPHRRRRRPLHRLRQEHLPASTSPSRA